jgi:SAM-dependent methyltransferase
MEIVSPCVVCGASDFRLIYDATLKECRTCGHVAANMQVDKQLLRKVYQENYFKGEEYVDYARDKSVQQHNFRRRLDYLSSFTAFRAGQRALEIGCAYGFFGEVLLRKFPFLSYVGFDVVPEACNYAIRQLSLDVRCLDFLEAPDPAPCSHVFMWDVIEHLNNPHLYIQKIAQVLEKGGRVYITTGDISGLLPRLQKRRWRMIHPPSHLHYFSKATISALLKKYGLEVLQVKYPSTARSLRQIYYSLFLLNKPRGAVHEFFHRCIPENSFVSLNTYDIMLVVAEKV